MPKTKSQKQVAVTAYKEQISASKAVVLVRPMGLSANDTVEIKKDLANIGASFNVVKNTLFKIALSDLEMPGLSDLDNGVNAGIFSTGDDISIVAKKLTELAKKYEGKLAIAAGIVEGSHLTAAQVQELADMPSREVIIAQIAGIMTNAVGGVANVLEDSVRSITSVLDQAFPAEQAS